jgi:hypothetical protein
MNLTNRQYIACKVLQSMLSNGEIQKQILKDNKKCRKDLEREGLFFPEGKEPNCEIMDNSQFVRQWHIETAFKFADDFLNHDKKDKA